MVSIDKEHLFKVIVVGDLGTGKTALIKKFVHNSFLQDYRATIGVDFAVKCLEIDENSIVRLQFWDISGQERCDPITHTYYKDAVGAIFVFDVTRTSTFKAIGEWKRDLDSKALLPNGAAIPAVLLANKCDLVRDEFLDDSVKVQDYCEERGFLKWNETSAKDGNGITEAFCFFDSNNVRQ